jgi:hypothetical protein
MTDKVTRLDGTVKKSVISWSCFSLDTTLSSTDTKTSIETIVQEEEDDEDDDELLALRFVSRY